MSWDAVAWAMKQPVKSSYQKFLLICMANYANDSWQCYPGVPKLCDITSQNRKTIMSGLKKLEADGFIKDTGQRKGETSAIKVYQLCDKKEAVDTVVQLDKQSQERHEAVPDQALSSTGSCKSLTLPIKKEPFLTNKEPINTRAKSVKVTLEQWEEKVGGKLCPQMMLSWFKERQISHAVATELVDDFRERMIANGNMQSDFRGTFQNWMRRGFLILTLDAARARSAKQQHVQTYDRGVNL